MAETAQTVQQSRAPQQPGTLPPMQWVNSCGPCLLDTEKTWNTLFQQLGRDYREPKVVIFEQRDAHRVRHRPIGDGAVLLSARSECLH